jgi:imidazolonepropionase-like amidohydrolase
MAAYGITTFPNMNAYEPENASDAAFLDGSSVLQLRARPMAGELWSPRIYPSGQWAPTRYHYSFQPEKYPNQRTKSRPPLDSVATFIAAYKAAGYDFVKVRTERPEIFDSVVAAARRVGIPVVGHVPPKVPLERALAGLRSIEHPAFFARSRSGSSQLDSRDIAYRAQVAATRRVDTWLCFPNHGNIRLIKYMQEARVGLLLGTDATVERKDFESLANAPHKALGTLVRAGLTPYQG